MKKNVKIIVTSLATLIAVLVVGIVGLFWGGNPYSYDL